MSTLTRSIARSLLLVAFVALVAPHAALSQIHPNHAQGFEPQRAFEVGDLENVNLFNGNLTLTLPIGQRYPVGGDFSYGLTLTYNGNVWEWEEDSLLGANGYEYFLEAIPMKRSNAGLGWELHLGRINPPRSQYSNSSNWVYESPDGALHELFPNLHSDGTQTAGYVYTQDGTYLRFDTSFRKLEHPDGSIQWFDTSGRLYAMEDRYGNSFGVSYPSNPTRWVITDDHNRTQTVYFKDAAYYGAGSTVDHIVLAAFGSTTATYTFQYSEQQVVRGWTNSTAIIEKPISRTELVPLLTGITLPDGSTYSMPVSDYDLGPATGTSNLSGHLHGMRLPTGGRLEWDWMEYLFPKESSHVPIRDREGLLETNNPFIRSAGVSHRRHKDKNGTLLGEWTYVEQLDPDARDKENRVIVTDPLGHPTTYYFSVYQRDDDPYTPEPAGWYDEEYGLPFSHKQSDGTSPGRYISAEIRDKNGNLKRKIYLRYDRDGLTKANPRLASKRTVFVDDGSRYKDVTFSDFDGVGHYRTTTTGGNYPAGNVRTTYTHYNPGWCATCQPSTGTDWILNTYTEQTVTEGGDTAKTEFCWDRGLMTRTRVLKSGTARSTADLVTRYGRDGAGNVTAEESFGGDTQSVGTGALCTLSLPSAKYRVDRTYLYGSVQTAKYSGMTFYSVDQDIDKNTGLPWRTWDTAGLLTTYEYDDLGRLTYKKPSQDGWTRYLYYAYAPSTGAPAQVYIQHRSNGGSTTLAQSRIKFDGLGRVWQEETLMPDGSWPTKETKYTGTGQVYSVSSTGDTSSKTLYLNYDPFGRPATIRPPEGSSHDVTFTYTGDRVETRTVHIGTSYNASTGAVTETTSTTTRRMDGQGRLYQVLEPSNPDGTNATTTYTYDVGGRLSQVSQQAKTTAGATVTQTRLFSYDHRGFLTSERHPEKGTSGNGYVSYSTYDARGHAGQVVDGPNTLRLTYDGAERLTKVEESLGFGLWRPIKVFTFATANGTNDWKKGKLTLAQRYNYPALGGTTYEVLVNEDYTYGGKQGRISARETTLTFNGNTHEDFNQTWTYNDLGKVSSLGYPQCSFTECNGLGGARTISSTYTEGFLSAIPGYASSITYHDNAMVNQVAHTNGVTDTWQADPYLKPRPQRVFAQAGTVTRWSSGLLLYDGANNVVKSNATYYLYDGVSRVTSGKIYTGAGNGGATSVSFSHTYDGFGNLQSLSTTTSRSTPTSSSTNRLTGSVSYDSAGELISWNGATYEYDAVGMMKRVVNGSEAWLYMYTADDERFWAFEEGAVPRFDRFWIRDLNGAVLRTWEATSYVWSWAEDHVYRDGQLLATVTPSGVRHVHVDHLGTPRAFTNSAGSRIAYHAYYPFGEEATAINQDTETMKFTGHERDLGNPSSAADDLDYLHARYFNPQLGRFLRIDPKGRYGALRAPQQWNRYCYAVGNPLAFIDPDGREIQLASETLRPFLVQTITRPSGRAILTRLDQSRQTVVFRDVKRNSDTVIMDARRGKLDSQKVHFELIGEIRSQSGERTGISIGIDAKAVEIAHPTDKTGVTTTAHGAHHAEAALGGMSIQEVRATGDNPTSEEGPAEQFGQRVAAEKPDLTEEQAEKYLDELLESKAQFEPK